MSDLIGFALPVGERAVVAAAVRGQRQAPSAASCIPPVSDLVFAFDCFNPKKRAGAGSSAAVVR
jgi:hypothetical protein